MKTSLVLAALGVRGAETRPLRVLLITGGCCHDYKAQKDLLKAGLEARANVEVVSMHSDDKSTRPPPPCLRRPGDWLALPFPATCAKFRKNRRESANPGAMPEGATAARSRSTHSTKKPEGTGKGSAGEDCGRKIRAAIERVSLTTSPAKEE